jgi:DNA-binding NarL/FixJ family response regulator
MTNIAIVEDDARFRKSLRRVIESNPEYACVAIYGTGAEALAGIPLAPPEVVIMDLNLPDMSGIDITTRLKPIMPDLSIIMLTVYNDADNIFKALRAGATGYLLKQATAQEILDAIAEALRGGAPMTTEIARKVIAAFREPPPPEMPAEPLAPREIEILDCVAQGYANKEIADRLQLTTGTVCWYLHEIYRKLHVQSRVQAVNKMRQSGLAKKLPAITKK